MNAVEFCYWLQGAFEINDKGTLSPQEVKVIKEHLALVFTKVTPAPNPYRGQVDLKLDRAPVRLC